MSKRDRHFHLRHLGHRGEPILPHRAIGRLNLPKARLARGVLVAGTLTLMLCWFQPWIATLWGEQLVWWMRALELPGQASWNVASGRDLLALPVPQIDIALRDVTVLEVAAHGLAVMALWIFAGWLPDHAKPGAFLLRFAALLHGISVVFFLLMPASFPHSLMGHVSAGLRQSWLLLLIVPWLLLLTYDIFPFSSWRCLMLALLTILFLLVLVPLQYASHVALMALAGPIVMPLLYLLFGLMLPVLGMVALYGWAMSWHAQAPAANEA